MDSFFAIVVYAVRIFRFLVISAVFELQLFQHYNVSIFEAF